ncbi:hypothetical protein ADJ70_03360 [Olsenella sp. oral taxon 807]|uniref:hypothetical protein n=1 Tax=Olsenella sp. oral taxon 807 TaxID=712411 RepID=UPI00067A2956|nr:hypothetical protein [Olsenella sp. oral taxon 807]AKT48219.1 hypothetical protein ADJ70_03360 [Olsenella sp. oral taxon 807]
MITSDERRAIAARADEVTFDMGSVARDVLRGLLHVLGIESEGVSMWYTDGCHALARIRELCELPDDWYVERGDEELAAHGLLRAPRDADGMPILPGDMLQTTLGGTGVGEVTHIEYQKGAVMVTIGFEHDSSVTDLGASLADEIDRWVDSEQDPDEPYEPLRFIARRLRKIGGAAR